MGLKMSDDGCPIDDLTVEWFRSGEPLSRFDNYGMMPQYDPRPTAVERTVAWLIAQVRQQRATLDAQRAQLKDLGEEVELLRSVVAGGTGKR